MKKKIKPLLDDTLRRLQDEKILSQITHPGLRFEYSRNTAHGDLCTNAALVLARFSTLDPRGLASRIVELFPDDPALDRVELAGNGFVNFFLSDHARLATVLDVLHQKQCYGDSDIGSGKKILLEFVSANPTGPLHVGHGRGAALGSALANLLRKTGYHVDCEYYVNDTGRQMDILTVSVWLRYLEHSGQTLAFPEQAYQGEYIKRIARQLYDIHGEALVRPVSATLFSISDPEKKLDRIIEHTKDSLDECDYMRVLDISLNHVLDWIKSDLKQFRVEYQSWFSERSLEHALIDDVFSRLQEMGLSYRKDGALWFRASRFGDKKDRVLMRGNGEKTYFASDVAYHLLKMARGYDHLINIWGADHHGYVSRLHGTLKALGHDQGKLEILLVQFATLYRGNEKLSMSTRTGQYVTLSDLEAEIGTDAARLFYSMRSHEQHLDFDLELAKSKSNENPVYYIQYAHARICSVLRKLHTHGKTFRVAKNTEALLALNTPVEQKLLSRLAYYPDTIESATLNREPHQLVYFLRDLANDFHSYYNDHKFISDDAEKMHARINLVCACKEIFKNGLSLLGVNAPKEM